MPTNDRYEMGIRWTIGDVNQEGFEALQLSIIGAWRIFGRYLVCVNCVTCETARQRIGELPVEIEWKQVSRDDLPGFLKLGSTFAEGTGWKFCPLQVFDEIPELALDNDCILWSMPAAMNRWLEAGDGCLIAEDVRPHCGKFTSCCGAEPRNSGIRGLGPSCPFEATLAELVEDAGELGTEGDEQGLQVACLQAGGAPEVVTVDEVTICSPFPPHSRLLGRCGAHFVGLNTRRFDWHWYGRNPVEVTREQWRKMKPHVLGML